MTHRKCCCGGGGGGSNTYGSCSKIDCDVEFEDEYCFEINGWKWLEILVHYARNLPQFGIRTHYDADGNPLADNTPVWWLRMDGNFDIQGSVDVRGFDRFRGVFGGSLETCPNLDCPFDCETEYASAASQKWHSGRTGDCYTTSGGTTRYSYAPNAANGQTFDELCVFDPCDPLGATVGYAGTANLQFRVFNEYRRGSASAPLVSTTTINQSDTVDFPLWARSQCLTYDGVAGLETRGYPYRSDSCEVSESDRLFNWSSTGFPATSADDQPTNSLVTFRAAAPGVSYQANGPHKMFSMFAPIGSGSPGAVDIDCLCPNGDKQRQWASNWDEVVPTTPAASAADMFDDYPNGLNAYGSVGTFARVYAFNTPNFVWGTCTP